MIPYGEVHVAVGIEVGCRQGGMNRRVVLQFMPRIRSRRRLLETDNRGESLIVDVDWLDLGGQPGRGQNIQVSILVHIGDGRCASSDQIGESMVLERQFASILQPLHAVPWIDEVVVKRVTIGVQHIHILIRIEVDQLNAA